MVVFLTRRQRRTLCHSTASHGSGASGQRSHAMDTAVKSASVSTASLLFIQCDLTRHASSFSVLTSEHRYFVYGHPDDDYRRRALEFGRESLLAYCVVVRYFRRQEYYRSREPV